MFASPWFRATGWALSILAIAYVGRQLVHTLGDVGTYFASPGALLTTALASFVYATLMLLVAVAWHLLVNVDNPKTLPFARSMAIFGTTQVLKYLPTNVLHVAGRYAATRAEGVPHTVIAFSTIAELGLVTATAVLTAIVFAAPITFRFVTEKHLFAAIGAVGLGIAACVAATLMYKARRGTNLGRLTLVTASAVALYALFFLLNGLLVSLLGSQASAGQFAVQPIMLGLVAAAWTAGFLIPGAPAGLGVREAVLIAGLESMDSGLAAVVVALSYRIATVCGDVILAGACALLSRRRALGPR